MALTATPKSAPTRYTTAYLIAEDVVDDIAVLLLNGGFRITAASFTRKGQIPHFTVQSSDSDSRMVNAGLTEREMQVLTFISKGLSNPDIGKCLFLSEDTIKTHCRRLFRKLQVHDRAHAVAVGYERGLLGQAAA